MELARLTRFPTLYITVLSFTFCSMTSNNLFLCSTFVDLCSFKNTIVSPLSSQVHTTLSSLSSIQGCVSTNKHYIHKLAQEFTIKYFPKAVIAINLRNQINFSPNKWLIGNKDLEDNVAGIAVREEGQYFLFVICSALYNSILYSRVIMSIGILLFMGRGPEMKRCITSLCQSCDHDFLSNGLNKTQLRLLLDFKLKKTNKNSQSR
ncbi:hypothetical protein AGLY_010563 [Aphis glycines]|uniref:Uncharacterized protein n=1 Tax=Aphis glycines TaxID=307491 RepID=A0A6G0TG36_APHGL|nr:hypothetical protein AGLY_010563 [Aphis glycines]